MKEGWGKVETMGKIREGLGEVEWRKEMSCSLLDRLKNHAPVC